MEAQYWLEKWAADRIGFHQSRANKRLEDHWSAIGSIVKSTDVSAAGPTPESASGATSGIAPAGRVFVPLCGKSLDMLWLHERGHGVLGVELSEKAVRAFFEENGLTCETRTDGAFERFSGRGEAEGIELLVGDFFALTAADLDGVDLFYDRASLIAMDDTLRGRYARHLTAILSPGATGLLLAIDYEQAKMQGPPFAVPDAVVRDLLGHGFAIDELAHHSGPERVGNLAERGLDTLDERVYRLRRVVGAAATP